jgi:hypothetical protein
MMTWPDLNEMQADLNGDLFPFGFIKLLWRLNGGFSGVPKVKTMRVPLMGVVKELQASRLASQLAFMMIESIRKASITKYEATRSEIGWILEDNQGMNSIAEDDRQRDQQDLPDLRKGDLSAGRLSGVSREVGRPRALANTLFEDQVVRYNLIFYAAAMTADTSLIPASAIRTCGWGFDAASPWTCRDEPRFMGGAIFRRAPGDLSLEPGQDGIVLEGPASLHRRASRAGPHDPRPPASHSSPATSWASSRASRRCTRCIMRTRLRASGSASRRSSRAGWPSSAIASIVPATPSGPPCAASDIIGSVAIDGEDLGAGIAHLRWFIVGDTMRAAAVSAAG